MCVCVCVCIYIYIYIYIYVCVCVYMYYMSERVEPALRDLTNITKNLGTKLVNTINNKYSQNSFSKRPPTDKDTTYINERSTYIDKVNNGEIREPKPSTVEYYEVTGAPYVLDIIFSTKVFEDMLLILLYTKINVSEINRTMRGNTRRNKHTTPNRNK